MTRTVLEAHRVIQQFARGDGDEVKCPWCRTATHIGGLIGGNTNQCPRCENPLFPVKFGLLTRGAQFVCLNGGRWAKRSRIAARCVEADSAFKRNEPAGFRADEIVYPY